MRDIVNTTNAVELAISQEQSNSIPIELAEGPSQVHGAMGVYERRAKTAEKGTRAGAGMQSNGRQRAAMMQYVPGPKTSNESAVKVHLYEND